MAITYASIDYSFTVIKSFQNVYHNWDMPEEEEED